MDDTEDEPDAAVIAYESISSKLQEWNSNAGTGESLFNENFEDEDDFLVDVEGSQGDDDDDDSQPTNDMETNLISRTIPGSSEKRRDITEEISMLEETSPSTSPIRTPSKNTVQPSSSTTTTPLKENEDDGELDGYTQSSLADSGPYRDAALALAQFQCRMRAEQLLDETDDAFMENSDNDNLTIIKELVLEKEKYKSRAQAAFLRSLCRERVKLLDQFEDQEEEDDKQSLSNLERDFWFLISSLQSISKEFSAISDAAMDSETKAIKEAKVMDGLLWDCSTFSTSLILVHGTTHDPQNAQQKRQKRRQEQEEELRRLVQQIVAENPTQYHDAFGGRMSSIEFVRHVLGQCQSQFLHTLDNNNVKTTLAEAAFVILRREAVLQWSERRYAAKLERSPKGFPSISKDKKGVMWPDTIQSLRMKRLAPGKVTTFEPDAPLATLLSSINNSGQTIDPLFGADGEAETNLLRKSFQFIRSGQSKDAMELCRQNGQSWRAASWSRGGRTLINKNLPALTTVAVVANADDAEEKKDSDSSLDDVLVQDNTLRIAWKKRMKDLSQSLSSIIRADSSGPSYLPFDAAIHSILADDVESGLANPIFRSWEDGVYIFFSALIGQHIDAILETRDSASSRLSSDYVDAAFASLNDNDDTNDFGEDTTTPLLSEKIHLLDDGDVFDRLAGSRYALIRQEASHYARMAMASFIVGRDEVVSYIKGSVQTLFDDDDEHDAEQLRFCAHLLLYLDSVDSAFLSDLVDNGNERLSTKDSVLLRYVKYLTLDKAHWSSVALYASLLSENEDTVQAYASFLENVNDPDDVRIALLAEARKYFVSGSDRIIIRRVVQKALDHNENGEAMKPNLLPIEALLGVEYRDCISDLNAWKMYTVRWSLYHEEHKPDGLEFVNALLRILLLEETSDKQQSFAALSAIAAFLQRFVPSDLADSVLGKLVLPSSDQGRIHAKALAPSQMEDLAAEHGALLLFIRAIGTYEQWVEIIESTSPEISDRSETVASGKRNGSTENEIALKLERKVFVTKKIKVGKLVIEAAEAAKDDLNAVLNFPGGWLVGADDIDGTSRNRKSAQKRMSPWDRRKDEMTSLRSSCLPWVAELLHRTLDGTADWMMKFVAEARKLHGEDTVHRLSRLSGEGGTEGGGTTTTLDNVSSPFDPKYWYKSSLSIANTVASNSVLGSFDSTQAGKFMELMAESSAKMVKCMQE